MNSLKRLQIIYGLVLVAMFGVSIWATMQRGIGDAFADLKTDRWFWATMFDAYFGFLTAGLWMTYRETSLLARVVWWPIFLCLGNIGIAVYILLLIVKLPAGAGVRELLLRPGGQPDSAF